MDPRPQADTAPGPTVDLYAARRTVQLADARICRGVEASNATLAQLACSGSEQTLRIPGRITQTRRVRDPHSRAVEQQIECCTVGSRLPQEQESSRNYGPIGLSCRAESLSRRGSLAAQHRAMVHTSLSLACPSMIQTWRGQRLSLHVHASGNPLPKITAYGLPRGVNAGHGHGSIVISGIPPEGFHSIRVTAENGGMPLNRNIYIRVMAPLSPLGGVPFGPPKNTVETHGASYCAPITVSGPSSKAVEGRAFYGSIHATGSLGTKLILDGGLPPGLKAHSLGSNISISGTPTRAGEYYATVTATNEKVTTRQSVAITVLPGPPRLVSRNRATR
jgi:hypothetical protein